jgi:hypothetical protein
MRSTLAKFVWVMVAMAFIFVRPAQAQPKALFFPSNVVPPPNGAYISPSNMTVVYPNGVVISNVIERAPTESMPPPRLGTSVTHTFNSQLDFEISYNNGVGFTSVTGLAQVTVNLQAIGTNAVGQQIYNTELVQLNVSGGNLPNVLQLRASTTKLSTGQTMIAPAPGGFMISSFFDIFTELSLDGGQTWSPSRTSAHLDMRPDPTLIPPVPEPNGQAPPPADVYLPPVQSQTAYGGGVVIKNIRNDFFNQSVDLLPFLNGSNVLYAQFGSTLDCQVSIDGGQTFSSVTVPAVMTVMLQGLNAGPPAIIDAQMTQLDASIVGLLKPVMLRQSPTLPSYGETAIGQASDGSYRISSFFDIFTEISLDGGNTWQPTLSGPAHVELQRGAVLSHFNVASMPPTNAQYNFSGPVVYPTGTSGVVLSNVVLLDLSPTLPLPPPGSAQSQGLTGTINMLVSTDNGQTFNPASGPLNGLVTVSNTSPAGSQGPIQYYDTALLTLNISGGNIPSGLMIRQSPSKPSLGRTSSTQDTGPTGGYRISSFFDVFTELSLNGGQSWNAVAYPSPVYLYPNPPYAPYGITCPSDITVTATSPSGAIVNYSFPPITIFPDCPLCCFTMAGSPPSGSLFPVGTTTVHGTGSDGCGEHPTCSFTITVLPPPFIYSGLVEARLGAAVLINSNVFTTNQYVIVSNLFADSADGFSTDLGSFASAFLNFNPFGDTANCPNDYVATAIGPYGSDPQHVMGTGSYFGGSNPMISADFSSLGASQVVLEVHDGTDNHLVLSNVVANGALIPVNGLFPPPCSNYNKTSYTYTQTPDHICLRFCIYGCNCLGTNCYIERVACFSPANVVLAPGAYLSSMQFHAGAANPPGSFTIQSQEYGLFGMRHQALGQASFDSRPGVLLVNNIGSSGQDGVIVDPGNCGQFDMTLAPTMLTDIGTCWGMFAAGQFNGAAKNPVCSLFLSQTANGLQIQGDFTPVGSPNAVVNIYDANGNLVAGYTETQGILGRLVSQGNLIHCGLRLKPSPGFDLRFDSAFVFNPQNGAGPSTGAEIQVLAANPAGRVQSFTELGITPCNIGQIAILGEMAQPVLNGGLKRSDGSFEVDGQGMAGATYQLQATPGVGLPAVQWAPVSSAIAGPDGSFQLFDSRQPSGTEFYRVYLQTPPGQ